MFDNGKISSSNTDDKMTLIYTRQSKEKEGSISQETQEECCKHALLSKGKEDLSNVVVLHEAKNMSGATLDRPELKKLLKMVAQGKVDTVIVYKLDRLSRSLIQFMGIISEFEKHGVNFQTAMESFDTSTTTGKMIVQILMVFAEYERSNTIARVKDAYVSRSQKGYYMGGRRPYGFNLEQFTIEGNKTKKLVKKEDEASQIQEIFNTYAVDEFSLRQVLKHMLETGQTDLSGAGFTTAKISSIMKSPIYAIADGELYNYLKEKNAIFAPNATFENFDGTHGIQFYVYNKEESDDLSNTTVVIMPHKGFIDSSVWIKCNKKLEKNSQIGNAVSNKTSWLGGLVVCQKCGHTMTTIKGVPTKKGTVRRYFNCIGKSEKKTCKGPSGTVYADVLEQLISDEIEKKLVIIKARKRVLSDENRQKVSKLEKQLKEIVDRQNKLFDMITEPNLSDLTRRALDNKIAELEQNKNETNNDIANIMNKDCVITKAIDLGKSWQRANFEKRRQVARTLIKCILVHSDGTFEIVWNI